MSVKIVFVTSTSKLSSLFTCHLMKQTNSQRQFSSDALVAKKSDTRRLTVLYNCNRTPSEKNQPNVKICGDEKHKVVECPERICNKFGKNGYHWFELPSEKDNYLRQLRRTGTCAQNTVPSQRWRKPKSCFIYGLSDHQSKECPQISQVMENPTSK